MQLDKGYILGLLRQKFDASADDFDESLRAVRQAVELAGYSDAIVAEMISDFEFEFDVRYSSYE